MKKFEVGNEWDDFIRDETKKDYFMQLIAFVENEYQQKIVYPPQNLIFHALGTTDINNIKVVILGQDPYHGEGEAHVLSFSVQNGCRIPPSLRNIYKEIDMEFQCGIPEHGCLEHWATQGVLLLNTVLTVVKDQPNSHKNRGWEQFTDNIIAKLNAIKNQPIVFMLWGNSAIQKQKLITNPFHLVLTAPHPSPFSARKGFFGCNHFKIANEYLASHNIDIINWNL